LDSVVIQLYAGECTPSVDRALEVRRRQVTKIGNLAPLSPTLVTSLSLGRGNLAIYIYIHATFLYIYINKKRLIYLFPISYTSEYLSSDKFQGVKLCNQ